MKVLKYIIVIILFVSLGKAASATTISGTGCMIYGNTVFVDKMGTASFGSNNIDVYNSNGTRYIIDYNNSGQCDQIPGNSVRDQNKSCWVGSRVNGPNDQSGVIWGNTYTYTVNTCTPMNLPLDDYTWVILLAVGGIGAFYISKKGLLAV